MKPLIILTGPTAAGKTELSIKLAKTVGGEIISADSMQIYKKMDIGTAKIMPEEMEGIPHYLVNELDPDEEFHVVRFQQMAKQALKKIYDQGKIPVVVGGTGFYIQALLYDIDFSKEDSDPEYREKLRRLAEEKGNTYLHEMLSLVDPESAQAIHENNIKRVIRALEYYEKTGSKISRHNEQERKKESCYNYVYFVLSHDREILYDRINKRVDKMLEAGLIGEVEQLAGQGYTKDMVSMQGIGYKEVFDYLEGKQDLDVTAERIKKDTRHFAKRQLTWFRREKDVTMVNRQDYQNEDEILAFMLGKIKEKGIWDGSVKTIL
ncbi:tRNA (adenosine(37)-N6)-dimethylallyltransferase MiaA [Anaerostipes sp.]|uniref:tRNA (adenosine(37)-N6)-dimethylallyltransferase MiaA n=1 Tax=Anaerostipes sp. TaxID=1872530 RepID=UPI0025BADBEE|nr:tRNA (adenosine(37)-N6)-dimethylallyltransferase MiaA [Anaerostipes sp.]MBS7008196.1 tRNA (adenosine(37)-N6)-dimethylallyltransferase MiaA [Anaerostipes sp.]